MRTLPAPVAPALETSSPVAPTTALAALRAEIEAVDERIVDALAQRMALARAVRRVKAQAGHPILDPAREAAVVAGVGCRARAAGLPEDEVRALFWRIMAMARREQAALSGGR
jgi:chorismate mutase